MQPCNRGVPDFRVIFDCIFVLSVLQKTEPSPDLRLASTQRQWNEVSGNLAPGIPEKGVDAEAGTDRSS